MAGHRVDVRRGDQRAIVPATVDDLATTLVENPNAVLVAGATDVGLWVTKSLRAISPGVFIGHLMKEIAVSDAELRIGAGVTYSEFLPVVRNHLPEVEDYVLRVGGWQVRNAGTIGGNIANGSPIGEMPPLLIALGSRIVLRRGFSRREIALEHFFIEYGKQDRAPGEFVETVVIQRPRGARIAAYKVSKRAHADISAVSACFYVREKSGQILEARVAFGGMAGTPRRARASRSRTQRTSIHARNLRSCGESRRRRLCPADRLARQRRLPPQDRGQSVPSILAGTIRRRRARPNPSSCGVLG